MCAQRVKLIYIQERRWQTQQRQSNSQAAYFARAHRGRPARLRGTTRPTIIPNRVANWISFYEFTSMPSFASSVLYSTGIAYIVVNIAAHPFCAPPRQRTHWRHGKEDCIRPMRTLLRIHTHTVHRSPCRTDLICDLDAALSARKLLCNFVYCVLWNNI